jgi:galactokinase
MKTALETLFRGTFGHLPDVIARAPGRVNLIGEHTDYNDGFVLPCAISKQTLVAARARGDGQFRLVSADLAGATASFTLAESAAPGGETWSDYLRGMVNGLIGSGVALTGADIAIVGNMPQGTGLSSSAALENAAGLALAAIGGRPDFDRKQLALLGQRTEHLFAGCNCGIMDQLVSASAVQGHALLIDCRSLETRAVPFPRHWTILIVQSGIERGLVDGEYNLRRTQCETAAKHYGVAALRDIAAVPLPGMLDATSYQRARHVITENARTLAAAEALASGDLARMGTLMRESHASLRDDFAVSLPAVDHLQQVLSDSIGENGGARLTGGGFGGAVVALLPAEKVAKTVAAVRGQYRTPDGQPLTIITELPSAGAGFL